MPFNELDRSAIGLAQEMDEIESARTPRQAWVTRSEGNGVWVRFQKSSTDPESWFPSTHTGLPAGFMGWVYPIGGGKGMFVASGVQVPITRRSTPSGAFSGSTSGQYFAPGGDITFDGLVPGRMYSVSAVIMVRTTGTSTRAFFPIIRAVGGTTDTSISFASTVSANNETVTDTGLVAVTASSAGQIVVTPGFTWSSGTVNAAGTTCLATLH